MDSEIMAHTDSISQLPDAILIGILSLLPAKDFMATMVLSKRWVCLWKMVPRLKFDASYQNIEYGSFSRFVDRSLLLHEAPVIETLHLKLGEKSVAVDIGVWMRSALQRCVRELILKLDCSSSTDLVILPRNLYTGCTMFVTLKLNNVTLLDFASTLVSFPSLKTLCLLSVNYPNDEFVKSLFSNCPVLEDLVVERISDDNVTIFNINVPSLKSLFITQSPVSDAYDARGFVIDAPSLELFDIVDHIDDFCVFENNMPNIVTANVDVTHSHPGKILSSMTCVERLYLCLRTSKDAYPIGTVFNNLVHLTLCTCETEWLNLLVCLLKDSPNLRALKLIECHGLREGEPRPNWIEPNSVPECLLSSLETLEWVKYEGTEEEKEVATFILRSAKCLKNAIISSNSTDPNKKLEMLKELSSSSRRSPTCHLLFD